VRVGQLGGEAAERRAALQAARDLQRDERVDEEREPLERVDHRLAQHRQAALGEALELPREHRVAELLLRRK
jgi:hypothetical protein